MSAAAVLAGAMVLDAALGEPRWLWDRLPHPAVLMGRAVGWADRRFNRGTARRAKGVAVMAGLGLGAVLLGAALAELGWLVELVVAAVLLAHRSLVDHVRAVADGLRLSLGDGRLAVSRIVGRDTTGMTEPDVARAAIESAAENFSDAVIAPAFWFLVAGLPGLMLYKLTNTADSMIGYRTERHREFGWCAARFDDLLNLLPARLSALVIAASLGRLDALRGIARDARLHRSPNAGWPEAAMARGLDVALAGPRSYDGQVRDYPFVHDAGRKTIGAPEIEATCAALWKSWGATLAAAAGLALLAGLS